MALVYTADAGAGVDYRVGAVGHSGLYLRRLLKGHSEYETLLFPCLLPFWFALSARRGSAKTPSMPIGSRPIMRIVRLSLYPNTLGGRLVQIGNKSLRIFRRLKASLEAEDALASEDSDLETTRPSERIFFRRP